MRISLRICVSQVGEHISLVIWFPGREHISLGLNVSQVEKLTTLEKSHFFDFFIVLII